MKQLPTTFVRLICAALLTIAGITPALAASGPVGTISGTVRTPEGDPLPGVTVTVSSPALQGTRTATTGPDGFVVLRFLPPGTYDVQYELTGFTTGTLQVQVFVGQTAQFFADMATGAVSDEIIVTGDYSAIAIDPQAANILPINREAFSATPEAMTSSVQLGPAGGQLRMGGGFPFGNLFLLGGAPVDDNLFGNANHLLVEDAVDSASVQTSNYSVEYGRTLGGVVNIVTRSGSNEFHGSFRADIFDRAWGNEPKQFTLPDQSNQTYTATLGGPILRDRLWFFAAGGARHDSFNTTTALGVPNDREADDQRFEGKLTLTPAPSHSLVGSYIRLDGDDKGVPPFSNSLTSSTFLNPSRSSSLFVAQYNGVLSSNLFAEAQFSQKKFGFQNAGGTTRDVRNSPVFAPSGAHLFNPARDGLVDDERDNTNGLFKLSYFLTTKSLGSHDIAAGYDQYITDRSGSPNTSSTGMSILADFQVDASGQFLLDPSGTPNPLFTPGRTLALFNRTFLPSTASSKTSSFFVNDQWRLNDHWTFDLGVRYDSPSIDVGDTTLAEDTNVAPRLGFTWDLHRDGKTVVRGGYGVYHDTYNVKLASDATFEESFFVGVFRGISGSGTTYAPGFNPNSYQLFAIGDPGATTTVNANLASPYVQEYMIGVSRRLGNKGVVRATYVDRTFKDLVEDVVPSGPPTTVSASGVSTTYDSIFITNSADAVRRYQGVDLQLEERFSSAFRFEANYTFSRLYGNYSGLATADTTIVGNYNGLFDLSRHFPDAALPNEEQQHRARIWTTYSLPLGNNSVDFGAIYRFDSGRAFRISAALPLTSIQQTFANSRGFLNEPTTQTIFFNDGETGHFDASHQIDASATFRFKPRVGGEVFLKGEAYNIFNLQPLIGFNTQVTPGGPADALGLPTTYTKASSFGQARAAADFLTPRTFRFSVGLRF